MKVERKSESPMRDLVFPWAKNLVKSAVIGGITLKTGPNGIPLALLLSPTFSIVFDAIYKEIEARFLSPREKYRIDFVSITALREIESRIRVFDGEPLRGRKHNLAELQAFKDEEMMLIEKAEFGGVSVLSTLGSYQSQLSEMGKEFVELFAVNQIPSHELLEIKRLMNRCAEDPPVS